VPPKPIRTLRNLTRYRKSNIRDRQREANRLHKILEDTGIKLDCVASDLLGKSGRAMLDALVSGTTDPNVLANLARGVLRKKLPALREALEGRFGDYYTRRDPQRTTRRLVAQLERLGHTVTLQEKAA
jgi:transposase